MIRVLIVDDSAFMRNALKSMISDDPEIEIAGIARDGLEAVEKVKELRPDVVTLDVEMPKMDGIEALRIIMKENPVPVIMVSSLTTEGAKVTLDALDIGAVDFIPKNLSELAVDIFRIREILIQKIKAVGRNGLKQTSIKPVTEIKKNYVSTVCTYHNRVHVVAIGASTGGPKALQNIISRLPKNFPVPILIAQHMPPSFTGPFAERLNQLSSLKVKEAENGEPVKSGVVYIAPGGGHMGVVKKKITETSIKIDTDLTEYLYRPSVDALMLSVAEVYSGHVLGVILTGLGNDGEKGMREIKNRGGRTIAESKESCVVYGMPKVVIESGLADRVVPLNEIPGEIINLV